MKRSKFLKSSKDLFSRSFSPSKCKTALKMAGSRVKILRNKKEVQVKQIKREIAQLLESGQDQTARIRVEHAVREEKVLGAYDLIEIYCELLVARIQIIESQKSCPNDLKEAIASLIFASPRCADVSELLDVKKQFTEKYGKDFVTAALEIRPQCGVSRLLVEKLAPTAPDGQTKIKILSAIAEEHNVKWDPKSFEENNSIPFSDSLNGTKSFEDSKLQAGVPGGIDVQPTQSIKVYGSPLNSSHPDHRSLMGKESYGYAQNSGVNTAVHHGARPLGHALHDERAEFFHEDSIAIPHDRPRWNMEFKDATAAAQAAAESAELASMAARAAAELSRRDKFTRQYSTDLHKSDTNTIDHGGPETYLNSSLAGQQFSKEHMNRSYSQDMQFPNEQIDRMKPGTLKIGGNFYGNSLGGTMGFSESASLKSKAFSHNDSLDHGFPVVDRRSQRNSFGEVSGGEMSMQRLSFKHKGESENVRPENHEREDRFAEQCSVTYSQSHSIFSDDVIVFANPEDQKFKSDATKTDSHESAVAMFDESDSDSDNITYSEHQPRFDWSSSGKNVYEQPPLDPDPSSTSGRKYHSSLFFSGKNSSDHSSNMKSVDSSRVDGPGPVKFDASDGSASEDDVGTDMSRHIGLEESIDIPSKLVPSHGSSFKEKGVSVFDRKQTQFSSDDEVKYEQTVDAYAPAVFSVGKHFSGLPASGPRSSHTESSYSDDSNPEGRVGLNFEKLTGGLRHKGYNPPFLRNLIGTSSSSDVNATLSTKSTAPVAVERPWMGEMNKHKKGNTSPYSHQISDSGSSEEEVALRRAGHRAKSYTPRAGKEVKIKPTFASSSSDSSDLDDDPPKESSSRTTHVWNGISQRTKIPSTGSGKLSYSRTHLSSNSPNLDDGMVGRSSTTPSDSQTTNESWRNESKLVIPNFRGSAELHSIGNESSLAMKKSKTRHTSVMHDPVVSVERKPTNSYSPGSRQQYQSLRTNSSLLGSSEQQATKSNSWGAMDEHHTIVGSKQARNSSAMEALSNAQPKTQAAASSGNLKPAPVLTRNSSGNNDNNQRASHVHPKLPDYNTLVQSLRKNRT